MRELELPLRYELAAFLAPFANFGAGMAFFGEEAGLDAALQLDGPDALRLRGIVGGRIEPNIKCQFLQLLKGHIRSRQGRTYVSDVLRQDGPDRTSPASAATAKIRYLQSSNGVEGQSFVNGFIFKKLSIERYWRFL
jgi:hypothetical protein